jgi:hypothetical protein
MMSSGMFEGTIDLGKESSLMVRTQVLDASTLES